MTGVPLEVHARGESKMLSKVKRKVPKCYLTPCERCALHTDASPELTYEKDEKRLSPTERVILILVGSPCKQGDNKDLADDPVWNTAIRLSRKFLTAEHPVIRPVIRCHRDADKNITKTMIGCCQDYLANDLLNLSPDVILCLGKDTAIPFNIKGKAKDLYNVVFDVAPMVLEGRETKGAKLIITHSIEEYLSNEKVWSSVESAFIKAERFSKGAEIKSPEGYLLLESPAELQTWVDNRKKKASYKSDVFAFDIETNGRSLHPKTDFELRHPPKVRCLSISWAPDRAICIPYEEDPEGYLPILKSFLEEPLHFIGHNVSYDIFYLKLVLGINVKSLAGDTMLMASLISPGMGAFGYGLKPLAAEYTDLGGYETDMRSQPDVFDKDGNVEISKWESTKLDVMAPYNCADADATRRLYFIFMKKIIDMGMQRAHMIMTHAIYPLGEMEHNGFLVDLDWVKAAQESLTKTLESYKEELKELAGGEYDWNSPMALGHLLYDVKQYTPPDVDSKLGIEPFGDVDTRPTDDNALLELNTPLTQALRKYRAASKLVSTYFNGYLSSVALDHCLRAEYNLVGTVTGRLSSSKGAVGDVNMQNIPKAVSPGDPGYEELKDFPLKRAFIARPGWKIVNADQSQLELRIAGAVSKEPKFIQSYEDKIDMHSLNAKVSFDLQLDIESWENEAKALGLKPKTREFDVYVTRKECAKIKKDFHAERNAAKTVSFGILYGMSKYGLARDLYFKNYGAEKIWTIDDCEAFINRFNMNFSQLHKWQANMQAFAKKNGYTYSWFGRRRFLPVLSATVPQDKVAIGRAMRAAINTPIQSAGSDFMMAGVYNMYENLDPEKYKFRATVHDSVVCEVRDDYVDEFIRISKQCLEHPNLEGVEIGLTRIIPFIAEFEVGPSYGELEEL